MNFFRDYHTNLASIQPHIFCSGYGDLYPQTNGQRFFGMFFVTAGIMILGGIALGIVFDAVFTMMEESTDASKKDMEKKFFDKFAETKDPGEYKVHISSKASSSRESGEKRNWIMKVMMNGCLIAMIFIPGLLIGSFEGWSVLESFYFCIVTATTGEFNAALSQRLLKRLVENERTYCPSRVIVSKQI